jgi:tRNA pseudouridine38-40 synthase
MELSTGRYFLELSFEGTAYNGWQIQPGTVTVQSAVEKAVSTLLGRNIPITGAGRTDTGVHAKSYTAHFDFIENDKIYEIDQFVYKLNRVLPPDIAVHAAKAVRMDAHARYSALSRTYEYYISRKKNPFAINRAWHTERIKDMKAMTRVTALLYEYDDFQCFSKSNTQVNHYRCKIIEASWREEGDLLIFRIRADRFLRNMVRAIVGTIIEAGLGKISEEDFRKIIESKNRSRAGYSVPGSGLYFMGAEYDQSIFALSEKS